MVSAESVLLGKLRDPRCTVWSARVLTMYHARNFKSTHRNTRARHAYECTACKLRNGGRSGCCL
jgi:hypothetical protein